MLEEARKRLFASASGETVELKDARDQTSEDKAIVQFVRTKLDESRAFGARIAQEAINLTNVAYLCGFDSVFFDSTTRSFKPVASPNRLIRQSRVHVNRILPTVQNRLARLTKNPPRWDVPPKSSDEEDKDAARLAVQVLEQLWQQTAVNRKRIPLTMWLQQCGVAYFKVCWDTTLGERKVMPKDKPPEGEIATAGQDDQAQYDIVAEGDLRIDVCSFFEIFPDPLAKSWDEVKYVIHPKIRHVDYFPDKYPERGALVKAEDCWLNSLIYEQRINSINTTTGAGAINAQLKDSAIEVSYYERPSSKHPYGRHIIIANGVKLKDDVLPIDEIPFVKFDDIVVGGKFNSESVITHLRPLQDQINRGKTMRAAWLNRTLTGKWMSPRGANLTREAFNDQSGEILEYDQLPNGAEPKALEPPAIPQYAYQEEDTLKLDMDDTAGVNQASRGQMPSAQIPAIGMQLLVEQDDTRIGTETENHEHAYADLGRIMLKFVADYYVTDRLLKVVGKNQEYLVKKFKGQDLKDNFDVRVIRGSMLPGSKTLKRQEIINMWQQGLFGQPNDPTVIQNVLSWLEYGDVYQSWKKHSLRMAQIQRGIRMIEEESTKPPVSEFDDHALWLQELDNYRISDKFLALDEEQQGFVLTIMNEHANFLQQMAAPMPDQDNDPSLKPTTAAQDNADQMMSEPVPKAGPGDNMPPGGSDSELQQAQENQMG